MSPGNVQRIKSRAYDEHHDAGCDDLLYGRGRRGRISRFKILSESVRGNKPKRGRI